MPPSSSSRQSKSFDRLASPVRRWIWRRGWTSLRDIQERAISTILDDNCDVIITAPTAGGKTEAAFLPLISSVLEHPSEGGFELVYIGPLRALINDQFARLEDLCAAAELPVHPWHGDISQSVKARARRQGRGILLITPESLEALFVLRGLEVATLFSATQAIIIDELHALLDNERGIHLASLLARMELATGRSIRRVGLSATLGQMELVKQYLRPHAPEAVELLQSTSDPQELKFQIRAYAQRQVQPTQGAASEADSSVARRSVAKHLFGRLRGSRNLIFAGSRQSVEWYADALREMSEKARLPVEFFPHHASLSREHRTQLESRLKSHPSTSVVCTSTLELGIDIGDIACVAQIGAPFSVASLRQRLGRSGRRAGQPAVLRMYAVEAEASGTSDPLDRLHLGLITCIAMVELLVDGWCEPPHPHALHLSTLVHQILSIISERGGSNASSLYATLCSKGPFRQVAPQLFVRLLRWIGRPEVALIEQAPDGTLLLGHQGERLVEHYTFYAVFQTPQEYRIVTSGKVLGTLPINGILQPGMRIVFSGRRWRIIQIHDRDKVVEVVADRGGTPPPFGGAGGLIHDRVAERTMEVLADASLPVYADEVARDLLKCAQSEFARMDLASHPICHIGERTYLIATSSGTVKTSTLALALKARGYATEVHDAFLYVRHDEDIPPVEDTLAGFASLSQPSASDFLSGKENLLIEKFHPYLSPDLLLADAASSRLDFDSLPELARRLIAA
ncbi:MAG: DEAD/DEAH box helicase [Gammaproteobacteria bacterium]|nr:DEAD/DEAH box helicase [Gammaproteobacteria bacterium]MDE0272281.1 DEAD/DEAH box helicase [Gammaproteobacteria bacterium]